MDAQTTPLLLSGQYGPELKHDALAVLIHLAKADQAAVQVRDERRRLVLCAAPTLAQAILENHDGALLPEPLSRPMRAFWGRTDWLAEAEKAPVIEIAEAALPSLLSNLEPPPLLHPEAEATVDLTTVAKAWALQVVARCLLGCSQPAPDKLLALEAALARLDAAGPLYASLPPPTSWLLPSQLRRARRQVEAQVHILIEEASASGLWSLLPGTAEANTLGLAVLALAYHMITSTAAFALLMAARQPTLQRRLRAEIDTVLGSTPPRPEALAQLSFAQRWIDETLRLYPPIWCASRNVTTSFAQNGLSFEKGQVLLFSPYIWQHHAATWPNPASFEPARFSSARPASPLAYAPWGLAGEAQMLEPLVRTASLLLLVATVQHGMLSPDTDAPPTLRTGFVLHPAPQQVHLVQHR